MASAIRRRITCYGGNKSTQHHSVYVSLRPGNAFTVSMGCFVDELGS